MNGSRSTPSRPGGASSLDALNRTIEGLEARIEGLMGTTARPRLLPEEPRREGVRERVEERLSRSERDQRTDPLAEIRQRQRLLEESRSRPVERPASPARSTSRLADRISDRIAERSEPHATAPQPRAAAPQAPAAAQAETITREITQALLGLRQELKQDISEGLAREISGLRTEMRGIRSLAEQHRPSEDLREDIARLADSIHHLGEAKAPGADGLRTEFEELRSLMDGLAREDSVRHMESRWEQIEERLDNVDPEALRDELVRLADRLDDIKAHLGEMGDNRAIHALEDKLVTLAAALEHIGAHIDPNERMMQEQFAGIDMRLDEITRAIAAGSRLAASSPDNTSFQRIEDRIGGLARQIELLAEQPYADEDPGEHLGDRIESLAARIEELTAEQAAGRLEERLDHLQQLLERAQNPVPQPELTSYLADISRKIDALDQGAVNDRLADRLDALARRIEEIDVAEPMPGRIDDSVLRHFEERLNAVVDRIEETSVAPAGDHSSLRNLEEQIAHLSALIGTPSAAPDSGNQFAGRISALEDYMATSDEYIIEAARQAAETVMESYARHAPSQGTNTADVAAFSALSDHLRHLEDFSRNSEERTHRTFEALHDTLVQIAGRLDQLGESAQPPAAPENPAPTRPITQSAREVVAEPVSPMVEPPLLNEHAAVRAQADTLATAAPAIESPRAEKKTEKPGLLAGLGKRLLPGQKKDEQAVSGRRHIDQAPSIDATDVLPPEEANELLEPGSGAPDVRKILERVRASQASQRADTGTSSNNGDRSDYIAAARRAAQAAALEMEQTPRTVSAGPVDASEKASAFARYRRPIFMAVGAILLAAMAMPLVNTLSRGEKSPAAIEASKPAERSLAPTGDQEDAANDVTLARAPDPTTQTADADASEINRQNAGSASAPAAALVERAPLDAGDPGHLEPAGSNQTTQQTDGFAIAPSATAKSETPAVAAADSEATVSPTGPAEIVVPAEITPPSLVLAAKQGDPLALFEIGSRYTDGRGVPGDFAEAAKWYKLAADKGFALAQYRLANLYEKGTGVPRDIATAMALYIKAATAGNASAMHNLAVLYASGGDGAQDYAKAAEWFGKAAELGVSDSQFNLAILYARGNGVPQDLEGSYKWFAIVAKNGDKDATQKRDEVANAMKPDQLERARAEVDLWKAKPLNVDANSANVPDEWVGKGLKTASVDMKKAIRNIQAILNRNGFEAGTPDGVMGAKTVSAIKAFQTSIGHEATGQVTDELVNELLARNK
ncbi:MULTISPECIES: peptidoglycan-binding protein [Alphaproteobacteria]|uniref:Hemagglutinin n=2 Tax=Alphaproteobacteria TaxID=28211 RepID=A0A512HDJ5_9HYPH|nr:MULTISPECIES: peptidoglycan-binding protein [Alphaproteobacteria]GEO83519.1 hemagglutinin [Ciceribacter naphthalenivorans]GLR24330.1 hemagglutinin [Ciceribacter naphthalenivorans]GLT07186.1 hemagglutinin [Sphingomonas psychrolutea]